MKAGRTGYDGKTECHPRLDRGSKTIIYETEGNNNKGVVSRYGNGHRSQRLSQIPANWGVGRVRRGLILTAHSGMSSPKETQASKMLYSLPNSNFPLDPTSFLIL